MRQGRNGTGFCRMSLLRIASELQAMGTPPTNYYSDFNQRKWARTFRAEPNILKPSRSAEIIWRRGTIWEICTDTVHTFWNMDMLCICTAHTASCVKYWRHSYSISALNSQCCIKTQLNWTSHSHKHRRRLLWPRRWHRQTVLRTDSHQPVAAVSRPTWVEELCEHQIRIKRRLKMCLMSCPDRWR